MEEGIVGGGGVALVRAIKALDNLKGDNVDQDTGIKIIKRALEEPLRQIVDNAGEEGAVIVAKVASEEGDFGYDAKEGKYKNMIDEGIIDPTKVARAALENATSVGGMLLTTECVITDIKKDEPSPHPMPSGGGGVGGMM